MNGKSCFFIGSRYTSEDIKVLLEKAIEKHIREYYVTTFTVGHYGNFDRMVIWALREAKKRHADIKLYLLAPYALTQKIEIPKGFDDSLYPDGLEKVPFRLAIIQANRYMVKNSDYLISYPGFGNSRRILEYAQSLEKRGLIKVTLL